MAPQSVLERILRRFKVLLHLVLRLVMWGMWIGEFRIKGDPKETGVIGRWDKRAFDFKLGAGENGIIFIEMNANSFVFRKPEAVDVSPVAQNF